MGQNFTVWKFVLYELRGAVFPPFLVAKKKFTKYGHKIEIIADCCEKVVPCNNRFECIFEYNCHDFNISVCQV